MTVTVDPHPRSHSAVRLRRARRIGRLDRSWAGHWSAIAVGPLDLPALDTLRALLNDFVTAHPHDVLAGRLDPVRGVWLPVRAAERSQHVERLVRAGEPPDLDAIPDYLEQYRPALDIDLPFVAVLSRTSLVVYFAHPAGDVGTFTDLVHRLSTADGAGLANLEPTAGLALVARAAVAQSRAVHRVWWDHGVAGVGHRVRARFRPDRARTPAAPAGERSGPPRPDAVGVALPNAEIRALTRWRNEHARGASISAVLAAQTYLGLVAEGVPIAGDRFFSLFDVRSYLPEGAAGARGNLAKSLRLSADLADPTAIDRAIKDVIASRRALPALLAGALTPARPGRGQPAVVPTPERVVLTVNSMPSLPALEKVPWAGDGPRRYFGVGYPTGPGGVALFVIRLRDRLEVTLSFDRATVDPDAARRALARLVGLGATASSS